MKRNLLCIFYGCAFALFSLSAVHAQVKGFPDLSAEKKSSSKVSPQLMKLYEDKVPNARRAQAQSSTVPMDNGLSKYIQVKGDMVVIDVTVKGDNAAARAELEKIGVKVTATFGRVISGLIPIRLLPELESAASVRFAAPAYKPMHQAKPVGTLNKSGSLAAGGPVISQGDTAQRSYLARNNYNVNGKGVKIGILSDSYDALGTADNGIINGELPGPNNPFGFTQPVRVLEDDAFGRDEGRAMAEIIHDVAPGAELVFHTVNAGQADFAQGILDLSNAGCKVINDDISFLAEPFFQDGIIAQAVDIVKQQGVTYFSAAGNLANRSYHSEYRPSAYVYPPLGASYGTAHNFSAPGNPPVYLQPISIPRNGTFIVSFQWDQPFFSAGGYGAETDMDIILVDSLGNPVTGSIDDNIASGDPVEVFGYTNFSPRTRFYLLILNYAGPNPTQLKYILYGDGSFVQTNPPIPGLGAPTIVGHAKAKGAIATGAVAFFQTPAYGVDTPLVEFYSSLGGTPHYFDKTGNRIATEIRRKPEMIAPDGGNTSFFFFDTQRDTDTLPNFFGTSAAAPHASGVAALMIEAQRLNTITPDQIRGVLSANTVDMDNIFTPGFDKGFDFNTGTGLIKADAAVNAVRYPNIYIKNLDLQAVCSDDPATKRVWKIINPNLFDVRVKWLLTGSTQYGTIILPPGETTFTTTTAYLFNRPIPNIMIIDWTDNFGFPHFDIATSSSAKCSYVVANGQGAAKALDKGITVETIDKPNTVVVYPNPSSKYFRVYLSLANKQHTDLELYSMDGKILYKKSAQTNGIIDIDASNYKPGMYLLKIKQGEYNKTFKLIRQ